MTVKECSTYCGSSERTIRDWITRYGIPNRKVMGKLKILESDWLKFCKEKNIEEEKL